MTHVFITNQPTGIWYVMTRITMWHIESPILNKDMPVLAFCFYFQCLVLQLISYWYHTCGQRLPPRSAILHSVIAAAAAQHTGALKGLHTCTGVVSYSGWLDLWSDWSQAELTGWLHRLHHNVTKTHQMNKDVSRSADWRVVEMSVEHSVGEREAYKYL